MTYLDNELYLELTIDEKITYFNKHFVPKEVYSYLKELLSDLTITVPEYNKKDTIINLMNDGMLEGWCFETTESAIVFFNDYDYICRGNIYINEANPNYHHSWITFKYNNKEYVFDAALNVICTRVNYFKLFNPKVDAIVSAKVVKEELINQFESQRMYKSTGFADFMKNNFPKIYNDFESIYKNRFYVESSNNINHPLYCNSSSYEVEIDDNKIKKLESFYRFPN